MQLFESIDRAQRMHQLIRSESTGTPCEFAERLGISRRQLYYLLEELKGFGAQIMYSRVNNTFYYANNFEFLLTINASPLNGKENNQIFGGNNENKWLSAISLHLLPVPLLM